MKILNSTVLKTSTKKRKSPVCLFDEDKIIRNYNYMILFCFFNIFKFKIKEIKKKEMFFKLKKKLINL